MRVVQLTPSRLGLLDCVRDRYERPKSICPR
jgi:hypothetical protein